ncbi:MAG: DMT family transporter [Pedosphaera sp.]|nr:DMT family transporter [Pedosphaera sp.]
MLPTILTTILFAISATCAGRTTRVLGGTEANFWRITGAAILLGVWAHGFGNGFSGSALPYFLASGCVGFGIGDLSLYQALPRLGARLCMILVHCIAAPFAAVIEWLWLGTRIIPTQVCCGILILAGVALALAPAKRTTISKSALKAGILFGTIAGCAQGFGTVLSRKAYLIAENSGEQIANINGGVTAAYQRIVAGWVLAAFSYVVVLWIAHITRHNSEKCEQSRRPLHSRLAMVWPWLLGNALTGPSLGVSCFQWALSTTPTAIVLPIVAVTPLVVIPFTRITEGDKPGLRSLAGSFLAVLGVVLLTWTRLRL